MLRGEYCEHKDIQGMGFAQKTIIGKLQRVGLTKMKGVNIVGGDKIGK